MRIPIVGTTFLYRGIFVDAARATVIQTKNGKTTTEHVVDVLTLFAGPDNKPFIVVNRLYDGSSITIGKRASSFGKPSDVSEPSGGLSWYGGNISVDDLVDSLGNTSADQFDTNHIYAPAFDANPYDTTKVVINMKRGTITDLALSTNAQGDELSSASAMMDFLGRMAKGDEGFATVYNEIFQKYGIRTPVVITQNATSDQITNAIVQSAFLDQDENPAPAIMYTPLASMSKLELLYSNKYFPPQKTTPFIINGRKMEIPVFVQ